MRDYITLISDSWKALKGNWGTVIASVIISYVASFSIQALFQFVVPYSYDVNSFLSEDFSYVSLIANMTLLSLLFFVAYMVFYIPIYYGLKVINLAVSRGYKPDIDVLLMGFKVIPRILKTLFYAFLKLLPYILINTAVFAVTIYFFTKGNEEYWLIPFGMISLIFTLYKFLDYVFIFELIFDEQNLDPKSIVIKSQSIMNGNKGYFVMFNILLFIFTMLGLIAFLIGIFVTMIVAQIALSSFYNDIKLEYEMKHNPHLFAPQTQNNTNIDNNNDIENISSNENNNTDNLNDKISNNDINSNN